MCCQEEKLPRRILIRLGGSAISKVFTDWYDLADYIKQENLAGRDVTIKNWEYV